MKSFVDKFCKYYQLPEREARQLIDIMELKKCRKGEYIVKQGERNNSLYIVVEGIWRGWYLRDGADVSIWFAGRGEAIISTWGYVADKQSPINVEAVTDSTILCIAKSRLKNCFSSLLNLQISGADCLKDSFWMLIRGL